MELRHLKYFVAVAEEQNITRAAKRLHVSQPPLSRQIRALEDELGVGLFEHRAKTVRLTEIGKVFLSEAQAVLLRTEEAVQTVRAMAAGRQGEIQVGFAPSLTVKILPKTLRIFHQSNVGIRVKLHDMATQEMLDALREDRLHAALLVQVPRHAMNGLAFETLQQDAVRVALPAAHGLAGEKKIRLKNMVNERLIAFSRSDYPEYHAWIEALFAKSKLSQPTVAEEHDSLTSLIAAVEAGRGIAVVSEGLACLAGPRLAFRSLVPAPKPFLVGIAWRRENPSPFIPKFVAAAKQAAST